MSTVVVVKRLRPYPVFALVAATLFIWVTRVPLAWSTTDGGIGDKLVPVIPVLFFVVPAALALVWAIAGGSFTVARTATLVRGLAIWTALYWAVRLPFILIHDHPVPFKVVHVVLAAVSVGAAAWAWMTLRRTARTALTAPAERHQKSQAASV